MAFRTWQHGYWRLLNATALVLPVSGVHIARMRRKPLARFAAEEYG